MNANKNKGKSFERDVAKHLTEIFGVNFQRVPCSGAFVGGLNAVRYKTLTPEQQLLATGDIIMPACLSAFSLECKFYKSFSFESLLTSNATLDKWIEQAKSSNKIWLLLFKINNKGAFVVFEKKTPVELRYTFNNYFYYNGYIVTKYEGFFEQNKDVMLRWGTAKVISENAPINNGTALTPP